MIIFSFISLGFISFLSQLTLIKEFMNVFYGNEFFIAIILSAWLLGIYIGSKFYQKTKNIFNLEILYSFISFFPSLIIILVRILKDTLFSYGGSPDIILSSLLIFILSFPLCFLLGWLFPFLVKKNFIFKIYQAYMLENIGFFIAGIFFYFFLIKYNSFISLSFIPFICGLNILFLNNKKIFLSALLFSFSIILFSFNNEINISTLKYIFKNENLITNIYTNNGNMIITQKNSQNNFYYNGEFLFSSENTYSNEIKSHIPLIFAKNYEKIIVIGNGYNGILSELKKYKPIKLIYIEPDNKLIENIRSYLSEQIKKDLDNSIIIKKDPLLYLKEAKEKFDIIFLNIPTPSSLSFNRFYSKEFLIKLKKTMNNDSILISYIPYSQDYLNENLKKINLSFYKTLKNIFQFVIFLPDEENIFIASDNNIFLESSELIKRYKKLKIKNLIVNEDYINYRLSNDRIREFSIFIKENKNISENLFFKPNIYVYEILRQIDIFYPSLSSIYIKIKENNILFLISIIFLLIYLNLKSKEKILFSFSIISATLISYEIIFIYLFQILFGNIHHKISIIISLMMLSISIGNAIASIYKILLNLSYKFLNLIFVIFGILLLISVRYIESEIIIFFLIIICGILFGITFTIISKNFDNQSADKIYSKDLIGALVSIFLITIFFIPFFGINLTILLLTISNIIPFLI